MLSRYAWIVLFVGLMAGCHTDPAETLHSLPSVISTAHAQFPTGCCSASSTGSATAANQTLEIAQLTAINGKMPTVGQKTMAASSPVVIASDQTALTCNIGTVSTLATAAKQDTGNTSLASIDTKLSSQATGANQATGNASLTTIAAATDVALSTRASAANQTTANSSLSSLDGKTPTVGQKAMAASSPVVIASDQSTLPVSLASSPLPSGAATEATLSTLNGKFGTVGQKTSAGSAPVVLASDQSSIPVTGSGNFATTNAASSQADGHSANIGALADASSASTLTGLLKAIKAAVTGTLAISAASLPLPTNAATDASVTGLHVAQASTTSGQTGALIQGAVTTAAPSYTTAKTSPLSLNTAGGLRVDGSATTQPTSSAASSQADGHSVTLGTTADASSATTVIGRLQKLVALLPTALVGGRLDENVGSWLGSTAPTVGSKTSANSIPVVMASDQAGIPVTNATASNFLAQVFGAAAAGAAASGNPVLVGGVDGSGNVRRPLTNTSGQLSTAPATSFRYVNSSTTTAVKTSAGTLRGFWITSGVAAAGAVLYDCNNCTSNPIAGFDATLGNQSYLFNIAVSNGITLVSTGGTPAQFTVGYDCVFSFPLLCLMGWRRRRKRAAVYE